MSGGGANSGSGYAAAVGGGTGNTASGSVATVGGGYSNTASVSYGTVSGGYGNYVSGPYGTASGGHFSAVSGQHATVGGGFGNTASGSFATVPGGDGCTAGGDYSLAAGYAARTTTPGTFVWADSSSQFYFDFDTANAFGVRASGGVVFYSNNFLSAGVSLASGGGSWTSVSDRNVKDNIVAVAPEAVLDKVAALPISTWNYESQDPSVRHMGPMAQDLYAAFGLGESDTGINTIDADGVALAAIQGLNQRVAAQKDEIHNLNQRLAAQNDEMQCLKNEMAQLNARMKTLTPAR